MKTITYILLSIATLGLLTWQGKDQLNKMIESLKSLNYKILKMDRVHFSEFGGLSLSFMLDMQIYNPTANDVIIPASIEKLYFKLPGSSFPFAIAHKNIPLNIDAKSLSVVQNIKIDIDPNKAIEIVKFLSTHRVEEIQIDADINYLTTNTKLKLNY